MSDWEDRINQVLNDPEQMDRIGRLAQSLMGGGAEAPGSPPLRPDPGMLGKLGTLLGGEPEQERSSLGMLRAIAPYLSPRRREKLERAMQLARLSRLAKLAFEEEQGHV